MVTAAPERRVTVRIEEPLLVDFRSDEPLSPQVNAAFREVIEARAKRRAAQGWVRDWYEAEEFSLAQERSPETSTALL